MLGFGGFRDEGECSMPAKTSAARDVKSVRLALRRLSRTNQDAAWAIQRLAKILTALELQLSTQSFAQFGPALAASKSPRRKLRLTPERRAALKLQGQYMGYLRGLRPGQKAQVKKIRVEKGIRAAIAAARRISA
jgi:hypothetical protein